MLTTNFASCIMLLSVEIVNKTQSPGGNPPKLFLLVFCNYIVAHFVNFFNWYLTRR
nr:MAG TPA: hypothetical protein [Caudoviricetes sp.]